MGRNFLRYNHFDTREGEKMTSESIGELVARASSKVGSVTELAKILGVSRSTVSRWIHGVHVPSADYMIAMQVLIKGKKNNGNGNSTDN